MARAKPIAHKHICLLSHGGRQASCESLAGVTRTTGTMPRAGTHARKSKKHHGLKIATAVASTPRQRANRFANARSCRHEPNAQCFLAPFCKRRDGGAGEKGPPVGVPIGSLCGLQPLGHNIANSMPPRRFDAVRASSTNMGNGASTAVCPSRTALSTATLLASIKVLGQD